MDFVFGQVCWAWNQRCFTHVLWCKFWTRWILSSGRSVGPGTNAVSHPCVMVYVLDPMDFVFGQVCWVWNQRCFTPMCYVVSSGPDGFCLRAGLLSWA